MSSAVRTALESISALFRAQPAKARAKNTPAVATLEGGLRCRVTGPQGESIATDMPAALGGGASAPNAGWYMRAALAACNATVIALQAAQRGIPLTALEVTVSSETDSRGMLGLDENVHAGMDQLRIAVRIGAPHAEAGELRQLVEWAIAHSPVGCTDLSRTTLDVEVE